MVYTTGLGLVYRPVLVYSVPMNKDSAFLPALLPIGVFLAGLDFVTPGHPLFSFLNTFLSQNGF